MLPIRRIVPTPLQLILLLAILALSVTLLTDGFVLSFAEAMWHYIGRNWFRHGLVPYSGGVDNKSPLIFAIFGLSDKLFGVNYWFPRVLGTVVQTIGIYYLYKIVFHQAGRRAGIIALSLYGLSLLWHITDGIYTSLTQTYGVTCVIIAFYIYLTAKKGKQFFLGGMIAALGCGFRLTAFFSILALVLASLRHRRKDAAIFCLGVLTGLLLLAILLYLSGINLTDFYLYGLTDNFGAGSPTDHQLSWRLLQLTDKFLQSEMILLYPGAVAWLLIRKRLDLFSLWAICVFLGINLMGMYDSAHLKDILPSLCVMNAMAAGQAIDTYRLPFRKIVLIIWIVFIPKLIEPAISFKSIFKPPAEDSERYCRTPYELPSGFAIKKLGRWIRSTTHEEDRVLVAGFGAQVQVYTERLSPSIYFNDTETKMARARWLQDMTTNKPMLIAVPLFAEYKRDTGPETRNYVDSLTAKEYNFDRCMYGYAIFRRRIK